MKKEDLVAMGLSEEQVEKVWTGLDGNYVTKSRFNEVNEENKTLKQSVSDRDAQLETLKTSARDNKTLKQQIVDLQKQNEDQKVAHDAELTQLKIDAAVEKALTDGGAKNIKAVKALLDLTDAKLGDDGSIKGLPEQVEKLKADEGSKFMFNEVEQTTFKGFQPGVATTIPNSKQAGYEARLADARKNNNQLEVIKIKQEAFDDGGLVLM